MTVAIGLVGIGAVLTFVGFAITGRRANSYEDRPELGPDSPVSALPLIQQQSSGIPTG